MRDSIFSSAMRSFFMALFAMFAICIGLIPLIIVVAALFSALGDTTHTAEPTMMYSEEIVANANGVRKILSKEAPVILKLNISGVIGTEALSQESIRRQLIESRERDLKDDRVKALLLYIDTPGGTAIGANGIYKAIKEYKERYHVPVYAFVDGLCASGGMYVACAADKIYATNVSLIGSVGVLSPSFFNLTQLMEKVGIQALTLTAGKDKDVLNPLRPWREGEQKPIQALIDYYYEDFVNIVASNRPNLDKTKLINEYGANIFNPKQAQEFGYIDASDYSYDMALKELVAELGVKDDYYQVIELQKKNWFSDLFKSEHSFLRGKITHHIQLTPDLDPAIMNQFLYLYRPER
jgi:signal peptide peptidase SppA